VRGGRSSRGGRAMTRAGLVALLAILHALACVTLAHSALPAFLLASHLVAKLLAAAFALAAYAALPRGGGLRRFWGALGAAYLLLALAELPAAGAFPAARGAAGALLASSLLLAANAVGVVASVLLALELRAPPLRGLPALGRLGLYLLAAAAVGSAVGPGLLSELGSALRGGGVRTWASAMSYACDAITFVLLVPVVRRGLALGSGGAASPLWAFTASSLLWILFSALEPLRSPSGASALVPSEGLRTAATLLVGLAGLFQLELSTRSLRAPDPAARPAGVQADGEDGVAARSGER
jgi:hypothetical protein